MWDAVHKETGEAYTIYRSADVYCRRTEKFNEKFRSMESGEISGEVEFPELRELLMKYAGKYHFEYTIIGFCIEADTKKVMVILELSGNKLVQPWRELNP